MEQPSRGCTLRETFTLGLLISTPTQQICETVYREFKIFAIIILIF